MSDDSFASEPAPAAPPPPPTFSSDGGGSTSGDAGLREPEESGRTFPCEGCGGDLVFHIGQQKLECPYCGHVKEISLTDSERVEEQDFNAMLARLAEKRQSAKGESASGQSGSDETAVEGASEIRCSSCGATVVFTGALTSTECAFCGARPPA